MSTQPSMGEVGIIGLVPEIWGPPWMPRHQILGRLARYFNVVWVTPPLGWREMWLEGQSLGGEDPGISGLTIYKPGRWLPRFYRPRSLGAMTDRLRLRQARRLLENKGARKIVLYVWRPDYARGLDHVEHDASCYHIDDEYSFSVEEQPIPHEEAQLLKRVDQVIVHSPGLKDKKGNANCNTLFVPNGVDYSAYATPDPEPSDLAGIPRPRIGYVGVIKSQLDLRLLVKLAKMHPEWTFVFVGPEGNLGDQASAVVELKRMINVHFLGGRPLESLPAYTQHMDVCLLCYQINDYTKFIYPLKLHEYLAAGRPVVGSPIRTLQQFHRVVTLAATPEEWSQALSAALSEEADTERKKLERQQVAREHDWNHLVTIIARSFSRLLGSAYVERFERLTVEAHQASGDMNCRIDGRPQIT